MLLSSETTFKPPYFTLYWIISVCLPVLTWSLGTAVYFQLHVIYQHILSNIVWMVYFKSLNHSEFYHQIKENALNLIYCFNKCLFNKGLVSSLYCFWEVLVSSKCGANWEDIWPLAMSPWREHRDPHLSLSSFCKHQETSNFLVNMSYHHKIMLNLIQHQYWG